MHSRREHGVTVTRRRSPMASDATYLFKGPFPDGPQVCEVADERDAGKSCWRSRSLSGQSISRRSRRRRLPQPGRRRSKTSASRTRPAPSNSLDAKKAQEAAEAAEARRIARLERAAQALLDKATVEARTIAAGGPAPGRARGAGEPAEPAHPRPGPPRPMTRSRSRP